MPSVFCVFLAFFLCLSIALETPAHAQSWGSENLPELGDAADAVISLDTEKKLGQRIMVEIRTRETTYLDDPEVEGYLNHLGGKLAAAAPGSGIDFYFFPLSDPAINAFATFGGFIGVNTGLILAVRNESELASVLAHEASHVIQRHLARGIARQKQISAASLLAMAVAILAAHSHPDAAGAAIATSSAGSLQAQLAYSRDFEREADRIGLQILTRAGFDPRGMSAFFNRLQQATRAYENNAPVYLRTHPLTLERIADMQNREQALSYRQVQDSLEFQLVRARLDALRDTPDEAISRFVQHTNPDRPALEGTASGAGNAAWGGRYMSSYAQHYGLAVARARKNDWAGVENALTAIRKEKEKSPLVERLYAEALAHRGKPGEALALLKEALSRFPEARSLIYDYADTLIATHDAVTATQFLEKSITRTRNDPKLYRRSARAYAMQKQTGAEHQALAEAYLLEGSLPAAIEQLELARKATTNDFYRASAIDARLRELKKMSQEIHQEKRG